MAQPDAAHPLHRARTGPAGPWPPEARDAPDPAARGMAAEWDMVAERAPPRPPPARPKSSQPSTGRAGPRETPEPTRRVVVNGGAGDNTTAMTAGGHTPADGAYRGERVAEGDSPLIAGGLTILVVLPTAAALVLGCCGCHQIFAILFITLALISGFIPALHHAVLQPTILAAVLASASSFMGESGHSGHGGHAGHGGHGRVIQAAAVAALAQIRVAEAVAAGERLPDEHAQAVYEEQLVRTR